MGTINYLQRKSPLASTPTTSAPSLLRPSRPFAPLSPSPSEQDPPGRQAQLQHAKSLEYSFDRIPIFPLAKKNNTGLPDTLKAGIEGISGISMDDVQVHYHSSKPAQMQALAYTQGADIHVGPGQEQHLPHEAWHVVQQKQGRVVPTLQASGVAINDDEGLEREADAQGARAIQGEPLSPGEVSPLQSSKSDVIQRNGTKRPATDEPRKSKRAKRPPKETWFNEMDRYFSDPKYTGVPGNPDAGGKNSTVELGPTGLVEMGTDANPNLPKAIKDARTKYPGKYFKAGHLLNADLGGDGQNAKNLTILTASANTSQQGFDNPVKRAVSQLYKLYSAIYDDPSKPSIDGIKCGIKVEVSVSDEKWHATDSPDNSIAESISFKATLTGTGTLPTKPANIYSALENEIKAANDVKSIDNI